jgi:flagellar motor switch protein FliG
MRNNSYVIQWKSTVNGRAGRGTKIFEREEASRLADELNREYPQILHEVVVAQPKPESSAESTSQDSATLVVAE